MQQKFAAVIPLFAIAACAFPTNSEDTGSTSQAASLGGPIVPFPQWYMLKSRTKEHNCVQDEWANFGGSGDLLTGGDNFTGHMATTTKDTVCDGNVSQAFRWTSNNHIVNARAGCMDAWNLLGVGGLVADSPCSGATGERWEIIGDGVLHNLGEDYCLMDSGYGTRGAGEAAFMVDCAGAAGWDWIPLPDPGVPAQKYVYAAMQGTRCLDAGWPNAVAGRQLQAWDCNGSTAQRFQLNIFTRQIKDLASGMCLDAVSGATNGAIVREWPCNGYLNQQWRVTTDGQIASYLNGGCLEVAGVSSDNGAAIQTWSCWGGLNQQWVHWQ